MPFYCCVADTGTWLLKKFICISCYNPSLQLYYYYYLSLLLIYVIIVKVENEKLYLKITVIKLVHEMENF